MIQWFSKQMSKKRKGFTLIELIVVIAILGILIAIAIPRLGGFQDTAKARAGEANAKMLTSVAQIVYADTNAYPADLNGVINAQKDGEDLVTDKTKITAASYTYTAGTGIVTYNGGGANP